MARKSAGLHKGLPRGRSGGLPKPKRHPGNPGNKGGGAPKGGPQHGTRRKGVPNRRTFELIERLEEVGLDPVQELTDMLKRKVSRYPDKGLTYRDKADIYLRMMKFIYPERKATEFTPQQTGDGSMTFVTVWGDANSDA